MPRSNRVLKSEIINNSQMCAPQQYTPTGYGGDKRIPGDGDYLNLHNEKTSFYR